MENPVNNQVREIAAQVAEESGLEFVYAEIVKANKNLTIRIFIDKEGGVAHKDCELVSRNVEKILDDGDLISTGYLLEVSSPGLERGLYDLKDFKRFAGHSAKVKTDEAINGQKRFLGKIVDVLGDTIVFNDKTKGEVKLAYKAIVKANLEIDLEEELKKAKS